MAATLTVIHALHLLATLAMTGLIWFVQLVHYPMMALISAEGFCAYERDHMRRTTWVVAPLMLVELATAVTLAALAFMGDSTAAQALAMGGLALLAIIWISTATLQVPCHRRLCNGRCDATISRLVRTNWLRTAAWTLRSVVAIVMLVLALNGAAA